MSCSSVSFSCSPSDVLDPKQRAAGKKLLKKRRKKKRRRRGGVTRMDVDGDKHVTFPEFLRACGVDGVDSVAAKDADLAKKLFGLIDADGSGQVDFEEFNENPLKSIEKLIKFTENCEKSMKIIEKSLKIIHNQSKSMILGRLIGT